MKKDIHPQYFPDAVSTCSCKNVIMAGSTKKEVHVEICSACHPFFTGKQKLLDSAGRVTKFKERQKTANKSKLEEKEPAVAAA